MRGDTVALGLLIASMVIGCACGRGESKGEPKPLPASRQPVGSSDLERAQALLDAGDIPGAVEPLRSAVATAKKNPEHTVEEIDFLLTQAAAASNPETAEARIGEMRDSTFEAFVERGELPRVPYFHDARIDAYFRKVLESKRADARAIRERRRAS